jgi:excinuclease ABC subunit C
MGYISVQEYAELVKKAMKFLGGDDEEAKRVLTQKMELAARNEDFERAIKYRDSLEMLKKLSSRTIANLGSVTDIDVFSYASDGTYSVMSVAIVRGNKMLGVRNYPIVEAHLETKDVYAEFIAQYYASPSVMPEELDFTEEFDAQVIRDYLAGVGAKIDVVFPKIGTRGRIAEMARRNASDFLLKSVARQAKEEAMTLGAANRLAEILGLPSARRIECFDISDISGVDQVASDVCFIDGKAEKSEYRRFSIKTVKGADDFASMREVIHRRLSKIAEGWAKPDLIVVDGGKGQLSSAIESVRETGIYVPVVSLAKKHEEIFVPDSDEPIRLNRDDNALKLMQRVRDEAHRFAVLYHRTVRAKRHGSELDKIPNIGKKNREILLSVFDSVAAIKSATLEELEGINGLNKRAARSVYDYFKENA